MAGDGAVDIDLYAQVDEFEPDVTGQVIFWSLYVKELSPLLEILLCCGVYFTLAISKDHLEIYKGPCSSFPNAVFTKL